MAGLREKKKEETLRNIVEHANQLIHQLGFEQMTMQQLAAKVGIGVGTLYNYFPSKSDLLLGILQQAEVAEVNEIHEVLIDPSIDVVTKLTNIMSAFVEQVTSQPRAIMREVMKMMVGSDGKESAFTQHIINLDQQFMAQVEKLVETEKQIGLRDQSYDTHTAVQLFYDLIRGEIFMYFLGDEVDRDAMLKKIKVYIRFIFGP